MSKKRLLGRTSLAQARRWSRKDQHRYSAGKRMNYARLDRRYRAEGRQKVGCAIWYPKGHLCCTGNHGFSRDPVTFAEGGSIYHWPRPRNQKFYEIGRSCLDTEVPF